MTDFNKDDVVNWLRGLMLHGVKLGLNNIEELLDRVGNPQKSFKAVHVAGSDGKGTTCAAIASILRESGISVGLYTSPHITNFNERISVNGTNISDNELLVLAHEVMIVAEFMKEDGFQCTFFEVTTAMAFLYFQRKHVEYAVVEVGMGGRFDATNVITPEVSVITNISREHTQYLGNTLREIAFEKAGIIKHNVPVVTCNSGDALSVITEAASERQSDLIVADGPELLSFDGEGSRFRYCDEEFEIRVPGSYQCKNAAMAVEAVRMLPEAERIEPHIHDGLRNVVWHARMEKIDGLPLIIDVSHTTAGMKVLMHDVQQIYGKVTTVFGVLSDKDLCGMAKCVCQMSRKVIVAAPESDRAMDIHELVRGASVVCEDLESADSVEQAIDRAMEVRGDGMVLVTGSFRMAEAAYKWLRKTYAGY